MKAPIKKKSFTKPTISSIREKIGLVTTDNDLTNSSAMKPQEFIPMPEAFQDALKLPGIPMGKLTIVCGHSNTGKSSLKNCLIASCINNGILPVIIETENNMSWKFAISCGVKATPVYGEVEVEKINPETGEVTYETETQIINYEGDFLYFDNKILCNLYGDNDYSTGKKLSKKRKQACIEDVAYCINSLLDMQENGEIQQPMCFLWDSVGSISSWRSLNSKVGNPMFDAASLSTSMNSIVNERIPSSLKVSEPYTNTLFFVNKIWLDNMSNPMGQPSLEMKGGKSITYAARLILRCGGVLKAATKKLTATAKGESYTYGLMAKIGVIKNQLDSPFNVLYENTVCCVGTGLIKESELDAYKKRYIKDILKELENLKSDSTVQIQESDITFHEEDSEEEIHL